MPVRLVESVPIPVIVVSALVVAVPVHAVDAGGSGVDDGAASSLAPATQERLATVASTIDSPVAFEPLPDGGFAARGADGAVHLTAHGLQAAVPGGGAASTVSLAFADGEAASATGHAPRGDVAHDYAGDDPDAWRTDVPRYRAVALGDVWTGVDVVVYGTADGRVEYDVVVQPGAAVADVEVAVDGHEALSVAEDGDLVIETSSGELRQHAPVAHQVAGGERAPVDAAFELRGDARVGLDVGAFDASRALVVDPVLEFASPWGGDGAEGALAAEFGPGGDLYVAGWTTSDALPTPDEPGVGDGTKHAFVARLTPDHQPVWATVFGGDDRSRVRGLTLDDAGNVYVAGRAGDTSDPADTFPTTPGAVMEDPAGRNDGFVAKLTPDGKVEYSTLLGAGHNDALFGIDVDDEGKAYVVGRNHWPGYAGFPTTEDAFQTSGNDRVKHDPTFAVIGPNGSSLEYATYLGSSASDAAFDVAVTDEGRATIVGRTAGDDLPTVNAIDDTFDGNLDALLAVFDPDQQIETLTYLGGAGNDQGIAVDLTPDDRPVAAFLAASDGFPAAPGGFQDGRGAMMRLAPGGQAVDWAVPIPEVGNAECCWGQGFAVDDWGNAHVAGKTRSQHPMLEKRAVQDGFGGDTHDGIAVSVNADGDGIRYSTYLGGSDYDRMGAVAVDEHGDVTVGGLTNSLDAPTVDPIQQRRGGTDVYLAELHSGDAIADAWTLDGDGPVTVREHGRATADNGDAAENGSLALAAGPARLAAGHTRAESSIDRSSLGFDGQATARAAATHVRVADGLVEADAVRVQARSQGTLDGASSALTGSVVGLTVAGQDLGTVDYTGDPVTIEVPGHDGTVTLFETDARQRPGGYSELKATGLHVELDGPGGERVDASVAVAWTAVAGDNLPREHPPARAPLVCPGPVNAPGCAAG